MYTMCDKVAGASKLCWQQHSIGPCFRAVIAILMRADQAILSFVTADLGIATVNRTNITLWELNHSIAKALAAVHWYGEIDLDRKSVV